MTSNFPNAPDVIQNNVDNTTPEFDIHPPLHNQLADSIMAVQVSLLAGGSLSLGDHLAAVDPHPVYLTQAEADARYPLASATDPYPVYLTQTEGDARYAPVVGGGYLTQVQADARYLQLAGGTLTGNLLFSTDNLRDIGAAGATRPRTLYLGTSLVTPGWTNGTHLLANIDNTYDIGQSGSTRPRTVYVGTSVVSPGWTNGTNLFANTDNAYDIGANGASRPRNVYAANALGASSGLGTVTFYANNYIQSAQNFLELRQGTSAQTLRVYTTYTDASNYTRMNLSMGVVGPGYAALSTEGVGTGNVARHVLLRTSHTIQFQNDTASAGWSVNFGAGAHLQALSDNTQDIGASAASRPRNVFSAGAVATGGKAGAALDTDVNTPTDGMLRFDSTNNRLYCRIGGTWRYAALT
jgi:hypothetical protein